MPRGIGIWLVDSWDAQNRFALVFADDGLRLLLLFFFHCSPFVFDERTDCSWNGYLVHIVLAVSSHSSWFAESLMTSPAKQCRQPPHGCISFICFLQPFSLPRLAPGCALEDCPRVIRQDHPSQYRDGVAEHSVPLR